MSPEATEERGRETRIEQIKLYCLHEGIQNSEMVKDPVSAGERDSIERRVFRALAWHRERLMTPCAHTHTEGVK